MFHFYAQPFLYDINPNDLSKYGDDVYFGHQLTEGLVQTLTNMYIEKHNLEKSESAYVEEVLLVENIIKDLKDQGLSEDEIFNHLINDNQIELIKACKNGEEIKNEYINKYNLHKQIKSFLKEQMPDLQNNKTAQARYGYYTKETNIKNLYDNLKIDFSLFGYEIDEMFLNFKNDINIDEHDLRVR